MNYAINQSVFFLLYILGSRRGLSSANLQIVRNLVVTIQIGVAIVLISMILSVLIRVIRLKTSVVKKALIFTSYSFLGALLWFGSLAIPTSARYELKTTNTPIVAGVSTTVTPQTQEITHVVIDGESLWRIAKRYYGKGSLYVNIPHNQSNSMINPGDILLIPRLNSK